MEKNEKKAKKDRKEKKDKQIEGDDNEEIIQQFDFQTRPEEKKEKKAKKDRKEKKDKQEEVNEERCQQSEFQMRPENARSVAHRPLPEIPEGLAEDAVSIMLFYQVILKQKFLDRKSRPRRSN